ncbi:DUF6268 family outer membrane beta-barrel protein [Rubinisphaera italica]|uniref:DUF6268 domain-containing protein n=1 Tax=Rubinisphaera italica TaxID=2527969 RepID=A0A5C5XG42_9PLAN|nr:DUF6268 family outer membrane beta-barrel protein [Rubinisphaera italica]TWT61145.1 hypothetical protein Pan54_18800 [Rubinisphaera italica]
MNYRLLIFTLVMSCLSLGLNANSSQAEEPIRSFHILSPVEALPSGPPVSILSEEFEGQLSHSQHVAREEWLTTQLHDQGGGWSTNSVPKTENTPLLFEQYEMTADQESELDLSHSEMNVQSVQQASYTDDFAVIGESLDATEHQQIQSDDSCIADCDTPWIKWSSTSVAATWLPGSGDRLGLFDFNIGGKIAFPTLRFLSISPRYESRILNGPQSTDVPGTLHRVAVSFMGMMPLREKVFGQLMVTPGVSTDFHNTGSDSLRVTGHLLAIYAPSAQLQWMFGVVYLNREDVSLLPAVGLTWSPDDEQRLELVFPRPRYMYRLSKDGDNERWGYLGAQFGGGSWAIERANNTDDVVTLSDYRLMAGIEYQRPNNREFFWETGVVFSRSVEYTSGIGDYNPDPTMLIRAGSKF